MPAIAVVDSGADADSPHEIAGLAGAQADRRVDELLELLGGQRGWREEIHLPPTQLRQVIAAGSPRGSSGRRVSHGVCGVVRRH
jgi:hypothetical protein